MTRDDIVLGTDQNRIREAELANGGGEVRDLFAAMSSRIVGLRDQPFDRPAFDLNVDGYLSLGNSLFCRQPRL